MVDIEQGWVRNGANIDKMKMTAATFREMMGYNPSVITIIVMIIYCYSSYYIGC